MQRSPGIVSFLAKSMGLAECGEAPWAKGEDGVLVERAVGFGPSPLATCISTQHV